MEFFEKAHVIKKNNGSSKKDNKAEENMKKQLKQMLHGYKNNDNEAIKSSTNRKPESDDSVSLISYSGFESMSTNKDSSSPSHEETDSIVQDVSISDSENANTSQDLGDDYAPAESDDDNNNSDNSSGRSNEYENNSEDMSLSVDYSLSKVSSDIESCSVDELSTPDSNLESKPFDENGELASNILKKLGKKRKPPLKQQIEKKRVGPLIIEDLSSDIEEIKDLNIADESTGGGSPADLYDGLSIDSSSTEAHPDVLEHSPAFVVIEAEENASTPSFRDILGDYKFSTIKNMSTEVPIINGKASDFLFSSELVNDTYQLETEEVNDYSDDNVSHKSFGVSEEVNTADSSLQEAGRTSMDFSMDDRHDSMNQNQKNDKKRLYETESEDILQRELLEDSLDSYLINSIKIYCCKNSCIIVLKHPAELYLHGKVKITPLGGTVQIQGHVLTEPQEVYAPNSNFAQQIQTLDSQTSYYGLFGKLTATGLSVVDTEEIVTTLGEFDAVLKFDPLISRKMAFVESNFIATDLFTKQGKNIDHCLLQASELLGCSLYLTRPYRFFEENASWSQAVNYGQRGKCSRGVVFGGKGTGKSSFLRYYVNRLLVEGPALVVDLDPGQSEFTVPGSVAATVVRSPLLGPNFTHLRTPDIMLNIGMIDVMDNLRRYVNAVDRLITECRDDNRFQNMPWIVNTMGFCNTVGLKLATFIILHLKPTFLLQMDSKNVKRRYECYLNANTVKNLYYNDFRNNRLFRSVSCSEHFDYSFVVSQQYSESGKGNSSLSARDERYLNLLAYFGELLDVYRDTDILGITPFEAPLQSLNICANVKLDWESIQKVINGKVIALCQQTAQDNVGKMFTLRDKPLLCHGHGVIRGIDSERELVYVLTPVPAHTLRHVNTLLYADWMPELRGSERQLPRGTPIPYRTATLHDQKQLMFTPRRRFNPLQFLKMSRNS